MLTTASRGNEHYYSPLPEEEREAEVQRGEGHLGLQTELWCDFTWRPMTDSRTANQETGREREMQSLLPMKRQPAQGWAGPGKDADLAFTPLITMPTNLMHTSAPTNTNSVIPV